MQAERLEEPAEEEDLWDIIVTGTSIKYNTSNPQLQDESPSSF